MILFWVVYTGDDDPCASAALDRALESDLGDGVPSNDHRLLLEDGHWPSWIVGRTSTLPRAIQASPSTPSARSAVAMSAQSEADRPGTSANYRRNSPTPRSIASAISPLLRFAALFGRAVAGAVGEHVPPDHWATRIAALKSAESILHAAFRSH